MNGVLPEKTIRTLLQTGVDAISADLGSSAPGETVLDDILASLTPAERTKARELWGTNPPSVMMGYARMEWPFPCYAVTLSSDDPVQDYIGVGEHALLDDDDFTIGNESVRRTSGKFAILVYAEHPDVCAWWYRVLRRILNVGIRYLIQNGLEEPSIAGTELAPDPRYTPENLFVRRVMLTVEYQEIWTDHDLLYNAINGPPDDILSPDGRIEVVHEDQPPLRGVHPYNDRD